MGDQLPPTVMVPSGSLVLWLTIQNHHQLMEGDVAALADKTEATVAKPMPDGDEDLDEDEA